MKEKVMSTLLPAAARQFLIVAAQVDAEAAPGMSRNRKLALTAATSAVRAIYPEFFNSKEEA